MCFKSPFDMAFYVGKYYTTFADIDVDRDDISHVTDKINDIIRYLANEPAATSVNISGVISVPVCGDLLVEMEIGVNPDSEITLIERRA